MTSGEPNALDPNPRRALILLAAVNAVYFLVEAGTSVSFGWLSVFFDALEFLERAVTLTILAMTPHWTPRGRYAVTALVVLPGLITVSVGAYYLWPAGQQRGALPVLIWLTIAVGSLALNVVSFIVLSRFRRTRISAGRAGYLAARADIWSSVVVLLAAFATYVLKSHLPDLVGAILVIGLHLAALTQTLVEPPTSRSSDGK